ncbi:unnamed protein product, partial [Symbiodinium sp. CCMP2456]
RITSLADLVRAIAVEQEGHDIAAPLQEALLALLIGHPAQPQPPAPDAADPSGPAEDRPADALAPDAAATDPDE